MNTPRQPDDRNDPDAPSREPGSGERRADFSNVQGEVASTETKRSRTNFGNPDSIAHSTEDASGEQTYTVQSGDSLSHIAEQFYGTAGAWKQIFEANRDQLDDPDLIKPGQVLKVPPKTD